MPRKIDIGSWARCGRTPKSTRITKKNQHRRSYTRKKCKKSTSFLVKTPFKSIPEQRQVREISGKMNIKEVEEPQKYENYHAKPVFDPFKTITEHPSTRITTKNEHRRSSRATKYENYQENPRARPPRPPRNKEKSKRTRKHETTKIATNSVGHLSGTSI